MPTDPFEHFSEQQHSYELIHEHRATLASEPAELANEHPEMQLVGLILEAGASEAQAFRAAIENLGGQLGANKGFLCVVPRELVLQILRANAPATLDWLPDSRRAEQREPSRSSSLRRMGSVSVPSAMAQDR